MERVRICLLKHLQLLVVGRLGYEGTVHGGASLLILKCIAPITRIDRLYYYLFALRVSVVIGGAKAQLRRNIEVICTLLW